MPCATIGAQFRTPLALSRNSDLVAFVDSSHDINIYKIEDSEVTLHFSFYQSTQDIYSLAFSPSGRYLAAAGQDGLHVYSMKLREPLFYCNRTTSQ